MSIIKKIYMLFAFFIVANNAFGQQDNPADMAIIKEIRNVIRENIVVDNIRDSTALYFFLIKINIKSKGLKRGYETIVEINNKSVTNFFVGLDQLKQLDYSRILINKKELNIFIRSEILVYGSKDNNTIKLADVEDTLKYMYTDRSGPFYDLFGIRLVVDKKVYH